MGDKGLNWLHNRYCSVESEQPQEVWGGGRLADAKKKKKEREINNKKTQNLLRAFTKAPCNIKAW